MKIFLSLCLLLGTLLEARMIGAVAMSVNDEPITTTEIKQLINRAHMSKEQAIQALIQQKLEAQAIQKSGIFVNDIDIDHAIQEIAKQNGVTVEKLKQEIAKQGLSYKEYRQNLAQRIKKDKLYKKVLGGRIKKADEADLKAFYNEHKQEFQTPPTYTLLQYSAPKGEYLQALQHNPMLNPKGIKIQEITIDPRRVNPKLLALIKQTPDAKFTPIINTGRGFVMFFVKSKNPPKTVPYEKVKNQIFAAVMKQKEAQLLDAYFQKLKSEAVIKTVRNF